MRIAKKRSVDAVFNVVCVLRRDQGYDFNYVKILSQAVRRNLTRSFRFVCLTDADPLHPNWFRAHRISYRPLFYDWPGQWARIELFRPRFLEGRILYLDLSTMVTGSLDGIADFRERFATLGESGFRAALRSDVMAWRGGDLCEIYDRFLDDPAAAMTRYESPCAWIQRVCGSLGISPVRFEDSMPDLCIDLARIAGGAPLRVKPEGTSLVSFRGRFKPHELLESSDFVREHWI